MAASGGGRLVIVKRDGSDGSSYPMIAGSTTIGGSKDCDVILTGKGVPVVQCTITIHPTEATIKNFANNNTTVVNSASVISKSLQHGDLISLGTAKFRWEYTNKMNSSKKNVRRSTIVKRTRNNISRRKSEPAIKKNSLALETKGRSSLEPRSRQIAIVMPQTRYFPTVSNINGQIQNKNKIEGKGSENEPKVPLSSAKKKKVEKVEKFDSPVILDKNKRAALLLLTKRTPLSISPLQTTLSKNTPKFKSTRNTLSSSSVSRLQAVAKGGSLRSANASKTPSKVSDLARQTIINQSKKRISMPLKLKTPVCTPDLKNKCNAELKRKLISAGINSHHKKRETLRSSSSANNEKQLTPTLKLNKTRRSLALKTPTPSKTKNSRGTPISTNNSIGIEKNDNNSPYMSFLSSLTNALNIMNNSEIDLEAVRKTPEFRAISNKIKSVEKLEKSMTKSPSPNILEIGRISRSSKRISNENVQNNFTSPSNAVLYSPIISPKHASPEILDSTLTCIDINTPNLSQVFDIKSSTPMDTQNCKQKNTPIKNSRRSRQLFQSSNENSKLFKAKSKTEPNRKSKVKINFNSSVPKFNLNMSDKSNNVENCESSINVTPKTTLKPPPEILKEKHSTAKKPVSRRSIIDHLTRSPEIAKELFKSPVKRKLSESMRHYDSYVSNENDNSASNLDSIVKDSSFELLTRSKRLSNISHEPPRSNQKCNRRSSNNTSNLRGVKRLLQTPAKSRNNLSDVQGLKLLFNTCSPRNNLSNIGNIKNLFNQKSPKNDLTNISGIENVFKEHIQKSTENNLTNISSAKLFRATRSQKSPKNDLTNVSGVKELFKTRSRQLPQNNSINLAGIKSIFRETKSQVSPKNDLSNVDGVKQLFRTTRSQKSPQNNLMNITGVENIFRERTPQNSPNSKGVKNPSKKTRSNNTPKKDAKLNSHKNDTINLDGVKELFDLPQNVPKEEHLLDTVLNITKPLHAKRRNAQSLPLNNSKVVKKVSNTRKSLRNSLSQVSDSKANLIKLELKNSSDARNTSKTNKNNKSSNSSLKNRSNEGTFKFDKFLSDPIRDDDVTPSSCVLENVGLVPTKLYKIKTENSTNVRSRRQATIDKTSFSLELSKVNTSIKKSGKVTKNTSPVIASHSTPFVDSKATIKGLHEVSPILPNNNNAAASTSRKTRNIIKTEKNIKTQPKKSKLNVKQEVEVKTEDLGNGDAVEPVRRQTRSGMRSVKKVEPVESHIINTPVKNEFSPISTLNRPNATKNVVKKKVTFNLVDDKDLESPKRKKTTRSLRSTKTDTVIKSEPSTSKKAVKKPAPAKKATKEPVTKKSTTSKTKTSKTQSANNETKIVKKEVIKRETKSPSTNKASASKTKKASESAKKTTAASRKKSSPQKDKAKTSKVKSVNAKKTKVTKISTKVQKATVKK